MWILLELETLESNRMTAHTTIPSMPGQMQSFVLVSPTRTPAFVVYSSASSIMPHFHKLSLIGILSTNLAVVAFALVIYFAAFLIVLSTWYVRNVMFQDSLFVKMRIYNADGRFLIEVLGKDL